MRFYCIGFLLSCSSFLFAQEKDKPVYTISSKVHYGFIWDFSEDVSHLANQHVPAIELNVTKQTIGKKKWQQEYRYPQIGYSILYYKFDAKKPIGNALALFIHAGKNFYKTTRSNLQWKLGFGGALVEKRFNTQTNFTNNVVSSRINFTINGQLNFSLKLTPRISINTGIGLLHISNGALKRPNFGINLPTAHFGLGYQLSTGEANFKREEVEKSKRKTYLYISPFFGFKEVYPVNGPKYFVGGMNALIERKYNRKSGLHIGVDINYDHSKKSEIDFDTTIFVKNSPINRVQTGILFGHELYLDKLSLVTQFGVYVYDPPHIDKGVYQKVGLKYYLSENIYSSITMKIHLGVADWIEWGIGFRL